MDFNSDARIIAACPNRMAPWVEAELLSLGYEPVRTFKTGVEIRGNMMDCIRLNLSLRCATQVRYSLGGFRATGPDDIYKNARKIRWEEIIPANGYFSVNNSAEHLTLNNTMFINMKVKDAIVDRFREVTGARPDSGSSNDHTVIHLHWKEDHAELFLDTSGEVISRHGYRRIPGKAPMQESLAAAVILATGWDRRQPFVNPMCGSGTLAIEAALLASGRKPGLLRNNYAFMHLEGYQPALFDDARMKLVQEVSDPEGVIIIASDIRSGAVEDARENARMAGVEHLIRFECCDFRETPMPEGPGVVVINPEYGERMGEETELEATYSAIGDFFKKQCPGYVGAIFTGNLELAKKVGLKANRRIEFYSAQLDCRLLTYELYQGTRRTTTAGQNP